MSKELQNLITVSNELMNRLSHLKKENEMLKQENEFLKELLIKQSNKLNH